MFVRDWHPHDRQKISTEICQKHRENVFYFSTNDRLILSHCFFIHIEDIGSLSNQNSQTPTIPSVFFLPLQSTILYCEAKKDENIQRYSRALDDLIGTVRRELVTIKNKVCSPALLDADSIPQVATEKLKLLKEDLANLSTKARNYTAYQDRFGSSMSSSLQKKALTE